MGAPLINSQVLINAFADLVGRTETTPTSGNFGSAPANPDAIAALCSQVAADCPDLWSGTWERREVDLFPGQKRPEFAPATFTGYESQSDADLAFCGYTARAAIKHGVTDDVLFPSVDAVFRNSGLMREKWDEQRGDQTYGEKTITRALVGIGEYRAGVNAVPKTTRLKLTDGLLTFSETPPPPRDFVIQDLMLAAKAALLAGLGGSSKSQLMLQACVCVALGLPFMGRATKAGAVLALLGEEDGDEISRRVNATAKVMRLSSAQLELVKKRLRVFPMVGLDIRLTKHLAGSLEGSGLAQETIDAAKALEAECGLPVRLIGLDHLGLLHGGDFNAREDAARTMQQVNFISQETGAAVVVLAHSPKASIGRDDVTAADVAGSAGFVDQSRGAFVLRSMDDGEGKQYGIEPDQRKGYVCLRNVKANYTAHGNAIWMKRQVVEGYEVSILEQVELRVPDKAQKGSDFKLRSAIFDLVSEKPCLTRNALEGYAGKDGRLRASKETVRRELETMLADGMLIFRQASDTEKLRLGIRGNTTGFLTLPKLVNKPAENA